MIYQLTMLLFCTIFMVGLLHDVSSVACVAMFCCVAKIIFCNKPNLMCRMQYLKVLKGEGILGFMPYYCCLTEAVRRWCDGWCVIHPAVPDLGEYHRWGSYPVCMVLTYTQPPFLNYYPCKQFLCQSGEKVVKQQIMVDFQGWREKTGQKERGVPMQNSCTGKMCCHLATLYNIGATVHQKNLPSRGQREGGEGR